MSKFWCWAAVATRIQLPFITLGGRFVQEMFTSSW